MRKRGHKTVWCSGLLGAVAVLGLSQGAHAEVWRFHTGEGVYPIDSDGETIWSQCTLDGLNPTCRERVHDFTREEIGFFVDGVRSLLNERIQTGQMEIAFGTSFLVSTGNAAKALLLAPEPTGVTKVLGVVSAAGAGLSGIYVAWGGRKIVHLLGDLSELGAWLDGEDSFARRCGHVRKNFVDEAYERGVVVLFPAEGGKLIPQTEWTVGQEVEQRLIEETRQYALDRGITGQQAYRDYFLEQCGQVPLVGGGSAIESALSPSEWSKIPYSIQRRALEVSQTLRLRDGGGIEFSGFTEESLDSGSETQPILTALGELDLALKWTDRSGSAAQTATLADLRDRMDGIVFRPRWAGSAPYTLVENAGRCSLVVGVQTDWWRSMRDPGVWRTSVREYFKGVLGLAWPQ